MTWVGEKSQKQSSNMQRQFEVTET